MEKFLIATGKTIDLAIQAALDQLSMDRDSVSVEVLENAKSGFLGIGAQPAKVKVSYEVPDEEPKPALSSASRSKPRKEAAPKFQCVLRHLDGIADLGIASWERPKGGYFVSCNTVPGLAKRTLALCSEAGVTMTGAGATFPYGIDPQDSNIRIAPSLPPVEELEQAMEVFTTSLRLAALEQLMAQ